MSKFILIFTLLITSIVSGCIDKDLGKLPILDRMDTLAGIDDNNNGVRDDIETYIEMRYPTPELHKPVMQLAAGFQESLTSDHSDRELQRRIVHKMSRAEQCFNYLVKNNPQLGEPYKLHSFIRKSDGELVTHYSSPSLELEEMTSNTKPRLKAYLMHNKALSGMAFQGLRGDTCE